MKLNVGDCREAMWAMPKDSIDAIVTDPPYELGFMGRGWDRSGVAFDPVIWTAALRVVKPGGHLLAFGGTRTYHRLAIAIEDAGWEIRDMLTWLYGQGMPKSLNLSGEHLGWGTGLKPAQEPIVLARRPLAEATVQNNMNALGTGALNIDATRIQMSDADRDRIENMGGYGREEGHVPNSVYNEMGGADSAAHAEGRWPSNVLLDPEAGEALDAQSGESTSAGGRIGKKEHGALEIGGAGSYEAGDPGFGDTGGASRFFYTAKASTAERNAGLRQPLGQNVHPTVKPIELMRYLIRLVTAPGGSVLDPFMGSGTTGCAAALEGRDFTGCELSPEYAQIAKARIDWWAEVPPGTPVDAALGSEAARARARESGQESLL